MARRPDIQEGMTVLSRDGRKLGSVVRCNDQDFQIEKGVFFPDEYLATYAQVGGVRNGEVVLNQLESELRPLNPLGLEATGVPASEEDLDNWAEEQERGDREWKKTGTSN